MFRNFSVDVDLALRSSQVYVLPQIIRNTTHADEQVDTEVRRENDGCTSRRHGSDVVDNLRTLASFCQRDDGWRLVRKSFTQGKVALRKEEYCAARQNMSNIA